MIAALLLVLALQGPPALEPLAVPCGKGAHEPQLSAAADGRLALVWGTKEAILLCSGDPAAAEFQRVRRVAEGLVFSVGMRRGPRVALLEGGPVVSVIGGVRGGGQDGDVLVVTAAGPGAPVRVNAVEGSAREGLHALARGPQGELFLAWIDLRAQSPQVFGALSRDAGRTWTLEGPVSHDEGICPCCSPSAAFDARGGVHVMWRGLHEGARDMRLASSSDGGKRFGASRKLGSGTWKLDACPMDGGMLAELAEGTPEAVWRREGRVYLSGGEREENLLGEGMQPWMARTSRGNSIVWLEKRNGALLLLAPGASEPERVAERASDPVLASAPGGKGPLYLAWETGTGEQSEIRLARR